ncbi:MAG: HWE histidine kinase domain-containing protein [Phormidesmis sp.]
MATSADQLQSLAVSNCSREPIHIPGTIQPFCALLATDIAVETITHVSDNLIQLLGLSHDGALLKSADILGQSVHFVLPRDLAHEICNACCLPTVREQREPLGVYEVQSQMVAVSVFFGGARPVIELEPLVNYERRSHAPMLQVRSILDSLPESSKMLATAVQVLRNKTGFDRVMAYRFLPDGAGEVVAEAKGAAREPFLGLRYPASDIPKQARDLALKTSIRVIDDVAIAPTPILAAEGVEADLDLSLALSRSPSAIHIEYLQNMGVAATVNVAIAVDGKLWGLFAFHHRKPRLLSLDIRSIVELFGHLFSLRFQQMLATEKFRDRKRAASTLNNIIATQTPDEDWKSTIAHASERLCQLMSASGLTLISEQTVFSSHGQVPSAQAILALVDSADARLDTEIVTIESLRDLTLPTVEHWEQSAGALLLRLMTAQPLCLAFFRDETIAHVRWGGNPEKKAITYGAFGPRLRPRASFEEYRQQVEGRCQSWTRHDLAIALEIRSELIRLTESQMYVFQVRQQNLLIAELNHRVRNILALIRSIARQTHDSTDSLTEYTETLEKRIAALATAHDLVSGHELEWPTLKNLLLIELRPYLMAEDGPRVSLEGPDVRLRANFIPTLVLVLHELVSNAVKYGALSASDGLLTIRWREKNGGLSLRWQESDGPVVSAPSRRGFGRELIERSIPYEFDGEATLSFEKTGVVALFWMPSELVRWHQLAPAGTDAVIASNAQDEKDLGAVLVVEDNLLIAIEMERSLSNLGFNQVDAAPSVVRALKLIEQTQYQIGVLDVNLKKETSFEVVTELMKRQTPVIFTTGYDSKYAIPDELKAIPILKKPIEMAALETAIYNLIS